MSTPARPSSSKVSAPTELDDDAVPRARPKRFAQLVVRIEADTLTDARHALARCSSRFKVGAEHWSEDIPGSVGELLLAVNHEAPTGAAYLKQLEAWDRAQASKSAGR